jgi:RimJ/RimL family protein N-acetyltransferase
MNASPQLILESVRMQVRTVMLSDSEFLLRCKADAERYIRNNIWTQYDAHGYGMYTLWLKSTRSPIGICGLVKRETLCAPDLGFALLSDHVGRGLAYEAARGVISHANRSLGIQRLYAIVRRTNDRSVRLLGRLGFVHTGPYSTAQGGDVELYVKDDVQAGASG